MAAVIWVSGDPVGPLPKPSSTEDGVLSQNPGVHVEGNQWLYLFTTMNLVESTESSVIKSVCLHFTFRTQNPVFVEVPFMVLGV